MSMYNLMMGVNPHASTLLRLLGYTDPLREIPRLRDCYVDAEGNVVVFTRTGGANRPTYQRENNSLRARTGFLRDEDWELDSTFAKWIYSPPPEHARLVGQLAGLGAVMNPSEKFNALMAEMSSDNPGPAAQQALERGRQILQPVMQALQDGRGGVFVVEAGRPPEPERRS